MLAARDQENLVHGHQQIAAAKPLNQGTRLLAPKTPGNKAPKTPFKIPLNDENGPGPFGGGKAGLKTVGKGNENAGTGAKKGGGLGDKDAFKTPMGPKNRAPLGAKTTNAKTKAFQIPPPPSAADAPSRSQEESASASARKSRPRVSHAEMTKLDPIEDWDKIREMDIEYMPPPAKNLPDYPDDIHETDLTPFPGGKGLLDGWMIEIANRPDAEGLTYLQRQELKLKARLELEEKEDYARSMRIMETPTMPCDCDIPCTGETCKVNLEGIKTAEQNYHRRMAEIYPERYPTASDAARSRPAMSKSIPKKSATSKGPSTLTSKSAANALSQKPSTTASKSAAKPSNPATKPRIPFSNISSPSKTTIGRSAGRATSTNYRKTAVPAKEVKPAKEVPDTSLPPHAYVARYGEPEVGSPMWMKCYMAGCFKEDTYKEPDTPSLDELLRDGADEEFAFEL